MILIVSIITIVGVIAIFDVVLDKSDKKIEEEVRKKRALYEEYRNSPFI